MARALDDLGVGHGERVAIVSPNSGRFLTSYFGVSGFGRILVPINFRLTAEEIAYIVEHSGASVLLYDPDLADEVDSIKVSHRFCLDGVDDAALFAPAPDGRRAAAVAGRRGRHLLGQLHLGDDGPAQRCAADPAQLLAERGTFGWHTGVSDRDVLLHTLPMFHCNGWGMPYAVTGMGGTHVVLRKVDGEEILSASSGTASRCCAARRRWWRPSWARPRRAVGQGRAVPGHGTRAHRGRRRPAAVEDDRAGRDPSWAGSSFRSTGSPRPPRC